ncbi:MAG: DUF924 domain-containing protein [Deltaproteobacteria bacterium]|nr:DUF924 domain-containing protein [Deltaproteobacteria bacterium]
MTSPSRVIDFFFGGLDNDGMPLEDKSALWWKKDAATDALVRERFGADVNQALAGERGDWVETSEQRLALILLLDQFTRTIFRDTKKAFSGDECARRVALSGLSRGHDKELPRIQRVFFYMPLEHAEDAELQARSVELFSALCEDTPPHLRKPFEGYVDFAVAHKRIVERFARFPHRNAVLGRQSTDEELEFLKQPGSAF